MALTPVDSAQTSAPVRSRPMQPLVSIATLQPLDGIPPNYYVSRGAEPATGADLDCEGVERPHAGDHAASGRFVFSNDPHLGTDEGRVDLTLLGAQAPTCQSEPCECEPGYQTQMRCLQN